MEHLTLKAAATTTDLGQFTAIAAAYTTDRDNEQIARGAFARTIARWQTTGRRVPLHWDHRGDAKDIIGTIDPSTMSETSEGLYVEGQLDIEDSDQAREVWRLVKRNAVGLSFGYLVTKSRERGDGVTELLELDLFEVSLTGAPVNQDARILSTKGATPDLGLGAILGQQSEEMIRIRSKSGGTEWIRVSDEPWWEADQRKEIAEFERKSRPIQVASFEV
jgi:HK97 family phage prohead protease